MENIYKHDAYQHEYPVVSIYSNTKGQKEVMFQGYGYITDDEGDRPYRFLEYSDFYALLSEVKTSGFLKWEQDESEYVKQYITDCTYKEMCDFYAHYNNGKAPIEIREEEINENIPDGMYLVIWVIWKEGGEN